jgi:hypothetical protein
MRLGFGRLHGVFLSILLRKIAGQRHHAAAADYGNAPEGKSGCAAKMNNFSMQLAAADRRRRDLVIGVVCARSLRHRRSGPGLVEGR